MHYSCQTLPLSYRLLWTLKMKDERSKGQRRTERLRQLGRATPCETKSTVHMLLPDGVPGGVRSMNLLSVTSTSRRDALTTESEVTRLHFACHLCSTAIWRARDGCECRFRRHCVLQTGALGRSMRPAALTLLPTSVSRSDFAQELEVEQSDRLTHIVTCRCSGWHPASPSGISDNFSVRNWITQQICGVSTAWSSSKLLPLCHLKLQNTSTLRGP